MLRSSDAVAPCERVEEVTTMVELNHILPEGMDEAGWRAGRSEAGGAEEVGA